MNKQKNYLEKIPKRNEKFNWTEDENGTVTLEKENSGIMNTVMQKLFKKPRISYIHLDETGSFLWKLADGEKTLLKLGEELEEHFGEKAKLVYERLSMFFRILDSYSFIEWK